MILFRYVIKEYFRYVVGTVVLCVFLFILFDFMHKASRDFAEYQPSGLIIARFYLYQLPFQIVQALPIASLLASVISMALLSRGNEVTVMRAAGMGPWSIGLPLLVGGAVLSVIAYLAGELVIPATAGRMHFVQDVLIRGHSDDDLGKGARWVRDKDRFVNFKDFDVRTGTLTEVKIVELGKAFDPDKVLWAAKATYIPERGNWRLDDISTTELGDDGMIKAQRENESALAFLPIEPKKLRKERRRPDEMSATELLELISRGESSGKDVLGERIALNTKWAYPLAAVLVSLMGLRFGYRSERSNEAVRNILLAFLVGISYWFILSAARALGSRGDLSPAVAAWTANVVIGIVVAFQMLSIRRT